MKSKKVKILPPEHFLQVYLSGFNWPYWSKENAVKAIIAYHDQFKEHPPKEDAVGENGEKLARKEYPELTHIINTLSEVRGIYIKGFTAGQQSREKFAAEFAEWLHGMNYDSFLGKDNAIHWITSDIDNAPTHTTQELIELFKATK